MTTIIDFVKSLFSPKALLGFIVGISIGFIATKLISLAGTDIRVGEFFAAILVAIYFWLYCLQLNINLTWTQKLLTAALLVFLLSIDSIRLIRQPVLLFVGGGEEKNFPPFDTYSYMISYGIICVFVGGLIETIGGINNNRIGN